MTENSRGKKKFAIRRGLTRVELTAAFGVGLTTVDRLIAFGLRPMGRRGRAKLYDPAAARRLAERLAPAQVAASNILIADYRSHAEDLHDRRERELETWIADATWRPLWQACVAAVARLTASWPQTLADRLSTATPEDRALVAWSDGPRPVSPTPRRYLAPEQILAWLAGSEAARPWRAPAEPKIAALAAEGIGVSITENGSWMPWNPATGIPQPPTTFPQPLVRPLLDELADMITSASSFGGLAAALQAPGIERLPPAPETVDEARAQWRAARAAHRRVRIAIRRGHRRREDVTKQIPEGIAGYRSRWWQARAELARVAGDHDQVRALAEGVRGESLERLLSLAGAIDIIPATPAAAPPVKRTRKAPRADAPRDTEDETEAATRSTRTRSLIPEWTAPLRESAGKTTRPRGRAKTTRRRTRP